MGCISSKQGQGLSRSSLAERKRQSGEEVVPSTTTDDFELDLGLGNGREAIESLKADSKLTQALSAKRRGDVFDDSFEPSSVKFEFSLNPMLSKHDESIGFLKDALRKNILFRDLTSNQLEKVLGALTRKKVNQGKEIIRQGDKGNRFYIVESGSFSILVDMQEQGHIKSGGSFGELALIYNSLRAATIKCEEDSVVWVLEREAFRHIVAGTAEQKRNEVKKALRSVSILKDLTMAQVTQLADTVERATFHAGETIIRKGEAGNIFFIVQSGKVKCTESGTGERGSSVDLVLGPGDYFGERSLLFEKPRAANVIAITDTNCLVLDRHEFDQQLGPLKELMDQNLGLRVLKSIPLLSRLSQGEIARLQKALKEETFAAGETIIKQSSPGTKFYLVKDGTAQVTKSIDGIKEPSHVADLVQGDYFGEGSLLHDEARSANVVASTPVSCLTMERKSFEKLLGPLQTIMKRELDNRQDQLDMVVKQKQKIVEESLKLSDLRMLKTLGTGTFGRVKICECDKLNRTYALKILQKAQIVAYRQQTNVMNEKNILMQCDHPFILRLYRTFKDRHALYLLLELVQGGELFSLLHLRGGSLSNSDSRFYAACVTDALEYLHSNSIVYRDLKPENLMIDDVGYIKVVDFGFAKIVTDKTYTLCGTPEYLSPELVLGKGHNKAVDNWAIGVLIFEMLTGASPFADPIKSDHMVICKNIMRGRVDFPRKFPEQAKDLVTRLLKRDAHIRLGSLKGGTAEIKAHSWFKSIDYNELTRKRLKAPWVPPLKGKLDTSCFDDYDEDEYTEPYNSRGSTWDEGF